MIGDMGLRTNRGRPWVSASYKSLVDQVMVNGAYTIVDYETMLWDDYNCVTTGAAWNYRVPFTGIYQVNALNVLVGSANWGGTEELIMSLIRNGAQYKALDRKANNSTSAIAIGGSALVRAEAGDQLSVRIYQNSGADIKTQVHIVRNWMDIILMRCL